MTGTGNGSAPEPRRGAELPAQPRSVFGEWLVLREVPAPGERCLGLSLSATEDVTRALRGALLHHAQDPPPAALSGHAADGSRLERPHVAILALPDTSRDARGVVAGAAVVLPRDIDADSFQAILLAAARWERSGQKLLLGRLGAMRLVHVPDGDPSGPLAPPSWTSPARHWASVTPVALDRNPGKLISPDRGVAARAAQRAEAIVARACERIGLPRPAAVRVMRRSRFPAVPPAPSFMPYPRKGAGPKRVCVHAELQFDDPVPGPILIGVGRYFGLGLCGPLGE